MKEANVCMVCGGPYVEVRTEIEGEAELPPNDATRGDLVMIDGSTMTVTVHEKCLTKLETNIVEYWHEILAAYKHGRRNWAKNGAKRFTEIQNAQADIYHAAYIDNVPLGLIKSENWEDYADRTG